MRDGGDAWKTEKTHIHWIVRFIRFLGKQHPAALLARRVEQCLSHLANGRPSSPATQRIALNALAYLYVGFPGVKLDSQ